MSRNAVNRGYNGRCCALNLKGTAGHHAQVFSFEASRRCGRHWRGFAPRISSRRAGGRPHAGHALAHDRAVSRRPHPRRGRRARSAQRLLHRPGGWRRLEVDRLRPHLESDLRSARIRSRSARLPLRRRTATSFMLPAAKACIALISPLATAFIARPMRERPGRTSGCREASRFPQSPSIPPILTTCSPRCSAILTGRMTSAESFAPMTAARPGRRCSTRAIASAAPMSLSIRRIRASSTPRCGKRRWDRGKTRTAMRALTGVFSNRWMAARRGSS